MSRTSFFSETYSTARQKFLNSAAEVGASVSTYALPGGVGPEGESLCVDVAVCGNRFARKMAVTVSGTHGIEGYAGSALQTAWMSKLHVDSRLERDLGVVHIHGINPWGFAYRQRVTKNNVDLNRNFIHDFRSPPANPGFDALSPVLSPRQWDEDEIKLIDGELRAFKAIYGEQAYSDAFNGGQYRFPDGIYYGGAEPDWSNVTFLKIIREHLGHASIAAAIDFHTGIGEYGRPAFLCFHDLDSSALGLVKQLWGKKAVDGSGSTHRAKARYRGLLVDAFCHELLKTRCGAVVVEFGTRDREAMQRANISLSWFRKYSETESEQAREVFENYIEAFYPSEVCWRKSILESGVPIIDEMIDGLKRITIKSPA